MINRFVAVRKEPNDFCAESLPWKATNGRVCSDARTEVEAQAMADSLNREGFKQFIDNSFAFGIALQ